MRIYKVMNWLQVGKTLSQKFENLFNLALETPEDVRVRTGNLNVGYNTEERTWEVIVKYHDSIGFLVDYGILVEELIAGYAILTVPENLVESLGQVEQIEYVEKPKRYFYGAELPGENSCVYPVNLGEMGLSGTDVLVAVLDSGIAYERADFRKEDGSTRIVALWDQTLVSEGEQRPPEGFVTGIEFSEDQINQALEAEDESGERRVGNGFGIVPSRDVSGHGTAVAGIAAGSPVALTGTVNVFGAQSAGGVYQGIAPESDLLIVKLGEASEDGFPKTTEIMRAVTYAVKKGIARNQPLVVNLSFGNTYGSHDGTSLLERFLDNAAEIGRTVICVGAGNEGSSNGHFVGNIRDLREVEITVGEYERDLSIQFWNRYSDDFRVSLRSPGGEIVELTDTVNARKEEFVVEGTRVLVYKGEPKPYSVLQETYFDLSPIGGRNYIAGGIWSLEVEAEAGATGQYDVYLPGTEARNGRTGILRATPETTLTIPSTSQKIVTVGAYNSVYEQYVDFSGRGTPQVSREETIVVSSFIKPDLVAPGVDIIAPDVLGGYRNVTGTSFATPIVSGSAALMMEWGIVKGNDAYLYGEKVKAYLRRGAQPLRGEQFYPNERVGFGKLCLKESIPDK